jgi:hypothetical protein
LHVAADEEDGDTMEMQEDRKPSPSMVTPGEGSEQLTSTGSLADTWKLVGLQQNIIEKGNDERFLTCIFVPSAGADVENAFAAMLENKGEVLNLRQRVPNLALDHVRLHKKFVNYDADNIEISVATACKSLRCVQALVPPMLSRKFGRTVAFPCLFQCRKVLSEKKPPAASTLLKKSPVFLFSR